MMLRSKSNPWMRTKALYIIPMATIAISVFATPELNNRVDTLAEKVETIIEDQVSEKEIDSADNIKEKIAKNAKENLTATAGKNTKSALDTCTWNENDPATWHEKYIDPQADVRPQFPGGDKARSEYYDNNKKLISLGDPFKEATVSIFVDVVVEKDGTISNAKISRFHTKHEISEERKQELKDAAIKFYSNMPKHIPAKKNGQAIRYEFTTGGDFKI